MTQKPYVGDTVKFEDERELRIDQIVENETVTLEDGSIFRIADLLQLVPGLCPGRWYVAQSQVNRQDTIQ